MQQALRDLAKWVEEGVHPSDTVYKIEDSQVLVPVTAEKRKGIQPVIDLKANGSERAETGAGHEVTFEATIEVPPGTGKVVSAEWDFAGTGDFPVKAEIDELV